MTRSALASSVCAALVVAAHIPAANADGPGYSIDNGLSQQERDDHQNMADSGQPGNYGEPPAMICEIEGC